jgi:hypothetical protein
VVAVNQDFMTRQFEFCVAHKSFASVPEGEFIPEFPVESARKRVVIQMPDPNPGQMIEIPAGMQLGPPGPDSFETYAGKYIEADTPAVVNG